MCSEAALRCSVASFPMSVIHSSSRFWRVLRYKQSDDLPAYPSGGGVLEAASLGVAPASGIASKKPTAGKYRVWARFRIPNDSNVSIAPCSIVVKQKGEPFKSVSFAIPSSDLPADLRAPEDAFVWLPYGVVELAGDEPVTVTFSFSFTFTEESVCICAQVSKPSFVSCCVQMLSSEHGSGNLLFCARLFWCIVNISNA